MTIRHAREHAGLAGAPPRGPGSATAGEAGEHVSRQIVRRHPMTSVALAFAAGALLSAWRTRD